MSKRNSYREKARKNSLLGISTTVEETKGDWKSTLAETGAAFVVGGILGSFAGHLVGKPSLALGVLATGASYYMGSRLGASFGIGMMAAGYVNVTNPSLSGTESMKDRAKLFAESLKSRMYLDKILKSKKPDSELGNVRYFVYPSENTQLNAPMDMSALDRLEQQVAASARNYAANNQPAQFAGSNGRTVEDSLF